MVNSETMKRRLVVLFLLMAIAGLPVRAQEKLYPVRPARDIPVLLTAGRSALVAEKAFQHKITLGFPDDDKTAFVPETKTPLVVLTLRIQNVSQRPIDLNTAKFISTDEQGRMYANILPAAAADKIIAGASGGSIGTKTLRSISLGKAGNKPTEEQLRADILRYSLQAGPLPPGGVREGLIYFEAPTRKKFTVSITLGELFSTPLVFSTEKQK